MVDIIFYLSLGVVFGYFLRVVLSDSEVRRLRRINEALIKHRDSLEISLDNSTILYSKTRERFLDLQRRYDKIYNNYKK